jgi:hypothetical protein
MNLPYLRICHRMSYTLFGEQEKAHNLDQSSAPQSINMVVVEGDLVYYSSSD